MVFSGYQTPAWILRGIVETESSLNCRAVGDDGISQGPAQLNRRYYAERARWWGAYDPFDLEDSLRVTDALFQANLRALAWNEGCIDPSTWEARRIDMAIAAHRQGLRGAIEHGMDYWYVERVKRSGK